MDNQLLRQLPKVDILLKDESMQGLIKCYGKTLVKEELQAEINYRRQQLVEGNQQVSISLTSFSQAIQKRCESSQSPRLQSVINGTGVVLHTNLGRSQLGEFVKKQLNEISFGYSNLEYDLATGSRGSRYQHLEQDLLKLTGAEAALVVNNNAAAVLLALQTFIQGKEIIISRGELVEIGGSFRIPDIIALSGGLIKEVGTTNKTHLRDYAEAINENTGAILKVHTSNYKVIGFTESVSMADLSALGAAHDLPLMNDLGSGLLIDLTTLGFPYEPTVKECVQGGCDIVTFSGDKLLGGPQAGIIVGKAKYINRMKANQLTRALRVDKMTLSALELTLKEYLRPETVLERIPTLRLLSLTLDELRTKASMLVQLITEAELPLTLSLSEGYSQVGGGSYPGESLSTVLVNCQLHSLSVEKCEGALRAYQTPIIIRIKDDQIQFDVRTIAEVEMPLIVKAFKEILT